MSCIFGWLGKFTVKKSCWLAYSIHSCAKAVTDIKSPTAAISRIRRIDNPPDVLVSAWTSEHMVYPSALYIEHFLIKILDISAADYANCADFHPRNSRNLRLPYFHSSNGLMLIGLAAMILNIRN